MTKEITLGESLQNLMENEMDRAELVLAAKAILDKLQGMAEDLAKVEADDVLPLLDGIRSSFGEQFAQGLNDAATNSLRAALEAVKGAKDQIGSSIQQMEGVVTGDAPANDMAQNVGTGQDAPMDDVAADMGVEATPDAEPTADQASDQLAGDISDLMGSEEQNADQSPEGRTRKESVETAGMKALKESANPDALVARDALKMIKESASATVAIQSVADKYSIDAEDVVAVMREYVESMQSASKMDKLLAESPKQWAREVLKAQLALREGAQVDESLQKYMTHGRIVVAAQVARGVFSDEEAQRKAKL